MEAPAALEGERSMHALSTHGRIPQRAKTESTGRKQVPEQLVPSRFPSFDAITDAAEREESERLREKDRERDKDKEREKEKPKKKKRSLKKMVMGDRQAPVLRQEYITVKSEAGDSATVTLSKGVRVTGEELTAFALAALGLSPGHHTLHCRWTGERASERPELLEVAAQETVDDLIVYDKSDGMIRSEFVVKSSLPLRLSAERSPRDIVAAPLRPQLPQPGNRRAAPTRKTSQAPAKQVVVKRPRVKSGIGPAPKVAGGPVLHGRDVDALDLGNLLVCERQKSTSPPWSPAGSPIPSPRSSRAAKSLPGSPRKLLKKQASEKEKKDKKLEKEKKEREKEKEKERKEKERKEKERREREEKEREKEREREREKEREREGERERRRVYWRKDMQAGRRLVMASAAGMGNVHGALVEELRSTCTPAAILELGSLLSFSEMWRRMEVVFGEAAEVELGR